MEVSTRLTPGEGRRFAFTVGLAFLVLAAISAWRGHYYPPRILATLGAALLMAGVLAPAHLGGVQRWWMALGKAISKVTSPIVIGAVYFVVMTPIGGLTRLIGRNPLRHREKDGGFWVPASSSGRSDLKNQY